MVDSLVLSKELFLRLSKLNVNGCPGCSSSLAYSITSAVGSVLLESKELARLRWPPFALRFERAIVCLLLIVL